MGRRALWAAAWAGYLLILALSLVPGEFRPRTGESHYVEHFVAYMVVSTVFGVAASKPVRYALIAPALCITAAAMELLQHFVPGRSPEVAGFLAGVFGVCMGALLTVISGAALSAMRARQGNRS